MVNDDSKTSDCSSELCSDVIALQKSVVRVTATDLGLSAGLVYAAATSVANVVLTKAMAGGVEHHTASGKS